MSIKLDYLPLHPELKIYQDDTMFCINTDTFALGEFLNIYRNDTVLDIGTNTGALMLYASLFKPVKIVGVEINKKACELAIKNMNLNHIENWEVINTDILSYNGGEYDVVICNPPYFKTINNDKGLNAYKALAKHEGTLNLSNLVLAIRKHLKNYGTLYLLYQTSRLVEIIEELQKNKMIVKVLKFVYDCNNNESNVVLIKACKGAKNGVVVEKPLIITRQ